MIDGPKLGRERLWVFAVEVQGCCAFFGAAELVQHPVILPAGASWTCQAIAAGQRMVCTAALEPVPLPASVPQSAKFLLDHCCYSKHGLHSRTEFLSDCLQVCLQALAGPGKTIDGIPNMVGVAAWESVFTPRKCQLVMLQTMAAVYEMAHTAALCSLSFHMPDCM